MFQKLKLLSLTLSSLLILSVPLALSSGAAAFTQGDINNQACAGTNGEFNTGSTSQTVGANCKDGTGGVNHIISIVLNTLSVVVGIIAVIMIIVAGLRYVTSGGKDEGVKVAKNTILYAIIGLVIVAIAQILVHFVLNTANNAATPTTPSGILF